MIRARVRIRAGLRRKVALGAAAVMSATLLQAAALPAATADSGGLPQAPSPGETVPGTVGKVKPRPQSDGPRTPVRAPEATWPKPGSTTVEIQAAGARKADSAGGPPVRLIAAKVGGKQAERFATGRAEIRALDRTTAEKTGANGPVFSVTGKDGTQGRAGVEVDYSSFAEAYGGSYASRLTLVQLPACALTTPAKTACHTARPITTTNDTENQTLTGDAVALRAGEPTVLAVTTAAEGDQGDFKATQLSPSATWNTNLNTGDFTWSYDLPVPEVPGELTPKVGLSYSSGGVDGRTGGTNNQSSWVGDGFEMWPGFIERRYKPCADDGVEHPDGNKPADLCWGYDNAFISFNGQAGELVPAGADEWKLKKDDGTRIKRLESADRGNGDNDGEYWRLTDPNGIRYYFGYNRLPGWASGKETTGSAWKVPVFGDDSGEPCHDAAGFGSSWCQQAWRWNLDYVVDPHGNAISYYYHQEENSYGRNLKADNNTRYTRGGSLDRIEYGLKHSSVYDTKPLAKVDFSSGERCLPNAQTTCDSIGSDSAYWYDTPWDLNCGETATCDQGRYSPSFWTRKRLTEVVTQVLKSDGTYGPVDSWKLAHRWGQADIDYQLLLDSIQRTGHTATPAITLPKTTFAYTQLANRLDKTGDGYAPFIKARLSSVADEYGGQITANYSQPACDWDALPTPQTNTTRCFPQYIGGSATADPERQWFNKYVTVSVTGTDRTGGASGSMTRYEYLGGAAWHYDDDDGLTKEKFKTWSQWRGYGQVRVKTGGLLGDEAMESQSDTYFLRGMHGDRESPTGGTKNVSVSLGSGEGDPLTDHESAAGFAYKTVEFSGPGGKVLNKAVSRPWHHQTAKKERNWGTVTANFTGAAQRKTFTSLDNGAGSDWRTTQVSNTYDTVAGRVTHVDDFGDTSTAVDNRCTRTTYATNADDNILTLPARVETVAKGCDGTVDRTKDVISDTRTAYDGDAITAAPGKPTKGDATATAVLKSRTASEAVYLESGATYDAYGRETSATDLTANLVFDAVGTFVSRTQRDDGRTDKTQYKPAAGLVTQVVTTTPPAKAGDATTAQTTTTDVGTLRGLPTRETDTNGKATEFAYDALGRSTKVWLPDRKTGQLPTHEFDYQVTEGKPVAVSTKTLTEGGGGQLTSYLLYDGFLRERQTQTPGPDGGRLVNDVLYNERGLREKVFSQYYATGAPAAALFEPVDALSVETQTWFGYDGLGRVIKEQQVSGNGEGNPHRVLATTTTSYHGDRTTVIPPPGGTATTTLTDARGQTTELRQHHARVAEAAYDTTRYDYTPRGELAKFTDPAGNEWSYRYDQLGRQTTANDPDKGTTTSTYDDRGQLTTTTDARGVKLAHVYDGLGRKTELRNDSPTGTLRSQWVYDTIPGAKGQLATSTRYEDGAAYTSRVTAYDQLYRPIRTAVTIPAKEGALAGTYQAGTAYKPNGLVGGETYSAAGSLPGGGITFAYDDILRPTKAYGLWGSSSVIAYRNTGQPMQYDLAASDGSQRARITNTYEWGTQRLKNSRVDRENVPGVEKYATYAYDETGNITSVSDVNRTGTDNQCFTYDYLRRLTEAWTEADENCETAPSPGVVGGPAAYWQSFTYDKAGNRTTHTDHTAPGGAAQDTEYTYSYPAPGQPQPHTLTDVTSTGPTGTSTDSYTYDEAGNTTTRTLAGNTQTLTWDAEGHLASVSEPDGAGGTKSTSYLYDADGNRLIGRTPAETTLYLGHTEVTLPKGATKAQATRYYDLGDGHQAVQEDDGSVWFTIADHHSTGQLAINAANTDLQRRRELPFGSPRGQEPADWPGSKGFVGGTTDTTTGLTHLGAREYDPTTGRFISVDPLMDLTDPQQWHGYAYANNNPITHADPTGLFWKGIIDLIQETVERVVQHKNYHRSVSSGGSRGGGGGGTTATQAAFTAAPAGGCVGVACIPRITLPWKETVEGWFENIVPGWGCLINPGFNLDCGAAVLEVPMTKAVGAVMKAGKKIADKILDARKAKKADEAKPKADSKSPECESNSFTAGTPVLMADGTTKPIEDVKVGDKVLATDPETGETSVETVTAEIIGTGSKNIVEITIDLDGKQGKKTATVTATDGHPFWVPELGEWIDATDLQTGQMLQTSAGAHIQITAIKRWTTQTTVYNLTVSDKHTYYVLAGQTPVLVHNSNGICGSADAHSFRRTEALSGNASKRNVDSLTASMKENGWQGDPISVAKIGDDLYVLDGHHRVAAAKRAGIDVPYRVLSDADIRARYPGGADDITTAWAEVGPDRLVNKYKRPGYR
ncbi:polymorphic toxin-type HINT domain-containing protein [Streptomyces sp. WMMC500]|uniref:polymorphic toxin-type HINT domain-containing protein n=1 Tax=Streptomyces sp. WMMC500 TaxID=3015154 RepID=UPI00248D1EE9|nr:polymorphic toxin-type HINT domain-containing protein [Streptomyces sp. WMMC500]WBB64609.1 polymorphic toxin-type HINT domain-containing protein [Streptomyces sp. WMMC500]